MCGIVGIVGNTPVAQRLLDGLIRLEYRGYDSAGIATITNQKIELRRAEGKLNNLRQLLEQKPLAGTTGIGHTRWATHGAPVERNAHPHATDEVAVVHNGIIENFDAIKTRLIAEGSHFKSDTDTEVIPHLISSHLRKGVPTHDAMAKTLAELHGAFAIGVVFRDHPECIYAARKGSPLAVGYGEGEMFMGSDAIALSPYTNRISYLEEGDWAKLTADSVTIYNEAGEAVSRKVEIANTGSIAAGKENYRHFMEKEIHEQPQVIGDTLQAVGRIVHESMNLGQLPIALEEIEKITLVACGTSYYAAMVAKYWLEQHARLTVETDIASEFRYRHHHLPAKGIAIFISQSGETADTLAALRSAKQAGQYCIAVVNVPASTIAREADMVLPTYAGPEIGVASTKAFTTQLTVLACLALALGKARGFMTSQQLQQSFDMLVEVPAKIAELLRDTAIYTDIAQQLMPTRDVLYLGRGTCYPIALEGALKLKEISYIHAEGYAAGEMKHGPIALIDESVPIIVLAPSDNWFEKTISNMQEAKARGGQIILITDQKGAEHAAKDAHITVTIPDCANFVTPILYSIPVQLLAYYTALAKGTDVDQPRNLAKSVTLE